MNDIPTLPSDRQLVSATREGNDAAWQELMERHEGSITAVLSGGRGGRRRSAKRRIGAALSEFRTRLETDADVEPAGAPAIRAFRPLAIAAVTHGAYGPADDPGVGDETAASNELLARAYATLPEPWQAVLWHSYVERLSSAEVSPLVGRSTSDIADLVATAERGLVDAYALEFLAAADVDNETAQVIPMLSGFLRDALPPHEQRIVERHLAGDDAQQSRSLIAVATALPDVLPPAIAPGITGLSVAEHRSRLGTTERTFGAATLFANRSDRVRRAVVLGSAAAVVLALFGVAYLVRQPFENDGTSGPATAAPNSTGVGTDPVSTTAPIDPTVPETTELELRPTTGPLNTIEMIIGDGNRPLGFVSSGAGLATSVSTAAPVFAGGAGTLDFAITNPGTALAEAAIELVLPRGVVLDGLVSGEAECADPENDSPFCNVAIGAGDTAEFSLRIALESEVVGRLEVVGETLVEPFETPILAVPDLIHNSVGRGGIAVIGNSVMTCDDAAAIELGISCDDVRDGVGGTVNRWDVPMSFIGAAPEFGLANGSTATLDFPTGSTIVHAHLFWSGDLRERGRSAVANTENVATLAAPGGQAVEIEADHIRYGEEDSTQYVGRTDVTDLIATEGAGDYLVGNIASVEVQGSYGAWALVVVFDSDDLPRRHRVITDPFDWVAPEAPFDYAVDMPVPVLADASARLAVVAFEGERGFEPEQLIVDGESIGGVNPFDSSIDGAREPSFDNNLGLDIDAYDLTIDSPDGTLGIAATSQRDGIRLAILALTVDLDQ